MRLSEWIRKEGLTFAQAAEQFGVANATVVRRYTLGTIPRPEIMERICDATRGEVAPDDFYVFGKPTNAA